MKRLLTLSALVLLAAFGVAQDAPSPKTPYDFRYSLAAIEDATHYSNLTLSVSGNLNQLLLEPKATLRYQERFTVSASLIGLAGTYSGAHSQLRVKETYMG